MSETTTPGRPPAFSPWRLPAAVLCLVLISLAAGCGKAAQPSAEQRALKRHQQDVRRGKQWQAYFKSPESARTLKALAFLEALGDHGQLLGVPKSEPQVMDFDLKRPVVSANGPYYWSQEFYVVFKDTPPRQCHYVVVQTYRDGDFQLQKAWRSDDAGKPIEESPIVPAPVMADPHRVFLGPANAGAERGWAGWFNGVLGGGSVAIGTSDPASGLSCFEIGISHAVPGQTHHADIRSEMFSLGDAARTRGPFTFSFAYKLPAKVNPGNNIEVNFRFFGKSEANFLGQETVAVGSSSGDSEMKQYKTKTVTGISAPRGAVKADVWIVANIDGPWTSGTAQFDDFAVTALPAPSLSATLTRAGILAALIGLLLGTLYLRRSRKRAPHVPASDHQQAPPP